MAKKYRSDALGALHETAQGLHRIGMIDTKTMRDFNAACLTSVDKLSAEEIAELRKRMGVSQSDPGDHGPGLTMLHEIVAAKP